jgi:hypothetical protein
MQKILYCKETCETSPLGYIHCIQSRGRDNPNKRGGGIQNEEKEDHK